MAGKSVSVYMDEGIFREVEARARQGESRRHGERSEVINRDLSRYYTALRNARCRLRELLSEAEMNGLMDVLNGVWMLDAWSPRYVWLEVEDGCRLNRLDETWGFDGAALVEKLKALDYTHLVAIVDAAERFWREVNLGNQAVTAADVFGDQFKGTQEDG